MRSAFTEAPNHSVTTVSAGRGDAKLLCNLKEVYNHVTEWLAHKTTVYSFLQANGVPSLFTGYRLQSLPLTWFSVHAWLRLVMPWS